VLQPVIIWDAVTTPASNSGAPLPTACAAAKGQRVCHCCRRVVIAATLDAAGTLVATQLTDCLFFERMKETEIMEMFDRDGDIVTVKSWRKEGIKRQLADVAEKLSTSRDPRIS
jgi:hypothetical protein